MVLEVTIGEDLESLSNPGRGRLTVVRQPTLHDYARRDEPFLERPSPGECEGLDTEASS
jgi:hypothetical protein